MIGEKMLEFKKDFIERIYSCNWIGNCGTYEYSSFRFNVQVMPSANKAIKSIQSLDWGNTCLETRNEFTFFLHINHNEEYRKLWNVMTADIRQNHLPCITEKIRMNIKKVNLTEAVINDIEFNVITLFMLNFYSDFGYDDPFWKQMFEIYMAGYLPCGWTGNSESGEFLIY